MKYWFSILFLITLTTHAQVNHWETVVKADDTWKYFVGASAPTSGWQNASFNDAAWTSGPGGFGYADNDDGTVIPSTLSVYLRKTFSIVDKSKIASALLHVDFDDGFVAYLNGTEISRALIGTTGVEPVFNQPADGLHEALLYQGVVPEVYELTLSTIQSLLVNGSNTLAVQVHNQSLASSDLSSAVFLSVGITDNSLTYQPVPSWFTAPVTFTSSNLPIITLNTNNQTIQDETRIVIDMSVIDNGPGIRNNVSDIPQIQTKASVEYRGESSQMFPKKSLSIETQNLDGSNNNLALLGMPPESDCVLYAPYTDKTMMRDVLAFLWSRKMGPYASRTQFCEVVLNGIYQGVFVLIEKIKRDQNRVAIAKLTPLDVSGDDLTGGYILRVDKIDGNDYPAWPALTSNLLPSENNINFQYVDPEGQELLTVQQDYIKNYIQQFSTALASSNFTTRTDNYRNYIDANSFVDFIISNELAKNVDGYIFSTYLYKAKDSDGGKLYMGPLWDFNLCYGNVDYWANSQIAPGWTYNDPQRMFWFRRMMNDPYFAGRINCRWAELRQSFLSNENISATIDSIAVVLGESQQRNYNQWKILGVYIWPNQYVGATYAEEINFLKNWIITRADWIDANLPGDCVITGLEETNGNLYPNPGRYFHLTVDTNAFQSFQIINTLGQEILSGTISSGELFWDGNDANGIEAPPGMYWIKLSGKKKAVYRFVKGE